MSESELRPQDGTCPLCLQAVRGVIVDDGGSEKWLPVAGLGHAPFCPNAKVFDDAVNHPKHYTSHPSGVECIDIVEHMTFNLGNVVKYLWRAGLKGSEPTLRELEKARWYLDREIEKLRKERADGKGA